MSHIVKAISFRPKQWLIDDLLKFGNIPELHKTTSLLHDYISHLKNENKQLKADVESWKSLAKEEEKLKCLYFINKMVTQVECNHCSRRQLYPLCPKTVKPQLGKIVR